MYKGGREMVAGSRGLAFVVVLYVFMNSEFVWACNRFKSILLRVLEIP